MIRVILLTLFVSHLVVGQKPDRCAPLLRGDQLQSEATSPRQRRLDFSDDGSSPLVRRARLMVNYPRARETFIYLGGYLVQRETTDGLQLSIERITHGGFLHKAGVRAKDRLLSVNYLDVIDVEFDDLLDSMRGLSLLKFGLERTVDGSAVLVFCVLDIAVGDDLNPVLTFVGFFWNTTSELVKEFIPLVIPSLAQYSFEGLDRNVYLLAKLDDHEYWLAVEGDALVFTTDKNAVASFTKYRYTSDVQPQPGIFPVIFSPTGRHSRCVAATSDNLLKLESFDPSDYKKPHVAGNERFLFKKDQTASNFYLESSANPGFYVYKEGGEAVMSTKKTRFSETLSEHPPL